MNVTAFNVSEYFLGKKIMDTQIGIMSAERSIPQHHGISSSSAGLRHLDPETDFKVKGIASRVNEALHMAVKEPFLGLYRIQEHVHRTLPRLVERKNVLKKNLQKIEDCSYDMSLSMDVVDNLAKITNFTRIQAALSSAIELKRNLNLLHEQEKARLELEAIKAVRANQSISINEPAEGYICPICYFAHKNQDDLITHWQQKHNSQYYENDVFQDIEAPHGKLDRTTLVSAEEISMEYIAEHKPNTTVVDIPPTIYCNECEDVVRSIESETLVHAYNTAEALIPAIENKQNIYVSEANDTGNDVNSVDTNKAKNFPS